MRSYSKGGEKVTAKSYVLWFTGLSGAGKSTLANEMHAIYQAHGLNSYVLDGDRLRHSLNRDLGYTPKDRAENIRRAGEVTKILTEAGVIVLAAFISPYKRDREMISQMFAAGTFIEVYVKCPLHICETRDPKGLYKLARAGTISNFTGITSEYEAPEHPELVVKADRMSIPACVDQIVAYLKQRGLLS